MDSSELEEMVAQVCCLEITLGSNITVTMQLKRTNLYYYCCSWSLDCTLLLQYLEVFGQLNGKSIKMTLFQCFPSCFYTPTTTTTNPVNPVEVWPMEDKMYAFLTPTYLVKDREAVSESPSCT